MALVGGSGGCNRGGGVSSQYCAGMQCVCVCVVESSCQHMYCTRKYVPICPFETLGDDSENLLKCIIKIGRAHV